MILKDLIIIDRPLFIEISAFVIIKRNSKYYEIAVRMRNDRNVTKADQTKWLVDYKDLTKRFMRECERVDTYYIISTKTSENIFGKPVHEEEITF